MDNYQFHRAYREIFNFTIIDLSGEYFDILKDRLYISSANDPSRKSAQTVLSHILEELTLMLSPVLVFTSEEVYHHTSSHNKEESVHLLMNTITPLEWLNDSLAEDFKVLYTIREESMKQLQLLRDSSIIGSSLEGKIIINCNTATYDNLLPYINDLTEILIISSIELIKNNNTELVITAQTAINKTTKKCERCWKIKNTIQDGLCISCSTIIKEFK